MYSLIIMFFLASPTTTPTQVEPTNVFISASTPSLSTQPIDRTVMFEGMTQGECLAEVKRLSKNIKGSQYEFTCELDQE